MLLFFCQINIFYEDQRRGVKKGGRDQLRGNDQQKKVEEGGWWLLY